MYKFAALGLGLAFSVVALTASAQTPTVTCSGAVTGAQVLWSTTVTGGIAPLKYAWTNGATSSTQTVTYATPGTYTIGLTVTDASSTASTTLGTASCVATTVATSTPPLPPPVTNTCQATSSVPVNMNSMLNVGPRGNVEIQGMKVLTVGSGSFTGSVWGITYTVNSTQVVTVGNYVKLNGKISTSAPMVIDARNVREMSAMKIKRNDDCRQDDEHGLGWVMKKNMQKKNKGNH